MSEPHPHASAGPSLGVSYLGLELAHPFIAGASPLSGDVEGVRRLAGAGASAIVLQSLYAEQLRAESMATAAAVFEPADSFGEATSYLPAPVAFRVGPGAYIDRLAEAAAAVPIPVIGSLNGVEPGRWLDHAALMEEAGAAAIELNVYDVPSDPTLTAASIEDRTVALVTGLRRRTRLPIAVKLSPFYTALPHLAGRLRDAGADGLVLFNRFFEPDIDVEAREFVPHMALSEPGELLLRLRWLAILSGELTGSLGVTGGVHGVRDAVRAIMCGADAVQLVSALFRGGLGEIASMRDGLRAWLEEHEFGSVAELRGSMNIERCPNPEGLTRAQYVRTLQTWTPRERG